MRTNRKVSLNQSNRQGGGTDRGSWRNRNRGAFIFADVWQGKDLAETAGGGKSVWWAIFTPNNIIVLLNVNS